PVQPGPGGRGEIGDLELVTVEHLAYVGERVVGRAVRREPVVHGDPGFAGHHIAGDASADADRVQAFAIRQTVDHRLPGYVADQPVEHVTGTVDRVLPRPRPRTV